MSKIKKDIEACMNACVKTDSGVTSGFLFPPEFTGFQGHFPGNKVVPGACQIQCVLSTIEKALEQRVELKEIILAKYSAPVVPGDDVTCTITGPQNDGSEFIYKARIAKGTEKVSDLKLRVFIGDAT